MNCTPPIQSALPYLLQEMAGRWCHQSVCLTLTIDVYGTVELFESYQSCTRSTLTNKLLWLGISASSKGFLLNIQQNAQLVKSNCRHLWPNFKSSSLYQTLLWVRNNFDCNHRRCSAIWLRQRIEKILQKKSFMKIFIVQEESTKK